VCFKFLSAANSFEQQDQLLARLSLPLMGYESGLKTCRGAQNQLQGNAMISAEFSNIQCHSCGTHMATDTRSCTCCGRVFTALDMQHIAHEQWINETRPLKIAVSISAALIIAIFGFALTGI
jgi:hypothetical protein